MADLQNVSGVLFAIRGGQLIQAKTQRTTERVVIVGEALDGPVNTPIPVDSVGTATAIFGPAFHEDASYMRDASGSALPAAATGALLGAFTGNRLIRALTEAVQGGATDIVLVRVGGEVATATLAGSGFAPNVSVAARALYPGSIYNGVKIAVTSGAAGQLTIECVPGKYPAFGEGATSISYTLSGYTKVEDLCNAINQDKSNGVVRLYPDTATATMSATALATGNVTVTLSGGRNGTIDPPYADAPGSDALAKNSYIFSCLTDPSSGTFTVLEDYAADIFLMAALNFDEGVEIASGGTFAGNAAFAAGTGRNVGNVAYAFGHFLHSKSKAGYPCMGVIGCRPYVVPNPDVADISQIVTNFTTATASGSWFTLPSSRTLTVPPSSLSAWINPGWFMVKGRLDFNDPSEDVVVPLGRYLSVVAGPDVVFTTRRGTYWGNGAGLYAGMVSMNPIQEAMTNKTLPGTVSLTYNLSRRQVNMMAAGQPYSESAMKLDPVYGGGAYVVFRNVPEQGLAVNTDPTAAPRDDQFADLFTWRIVAAVSNQVRKAVYPFIGKENTIESRMAMTTAVRSALEWAAQMGVLMPGEGTGYEFSLSSSALDQIVGRVTIELKIRPVFQIRQIKVVVSVAR